MAKKKRGQNEGSIYQRQDGRWVAAITVQGKQVTKYCKTKRECQEWIKQQQALLDNGVDLIAAQVTVATFLDEWLVAHSASVRDSTIIQYRQIVNQHIKPTLGSIKLKDLRPDQIQRLYNQKLSSRVSNRSVQLIHGVLHCALNYALRQGLLGRNPSDPVEKPRQRRPEIKTLNDQQARAFLLASRTSRHATLYYVAITTGLRQGELLGLKWSDLDWGKKQVYVQRQVKRIPKQGIQFLEPKTHTGRRIIELGSATIAHLREHLKQQALERQIAGERWQEHDLIFPSTTGTPMDCHNLLKDFKELLRQCNLPEIRFHDLRHTAATLMLQQNVHPKVVQERLGHADISLTLNTYSHVMPGMQADAAERLDELLTPIEVTAEFDEVHPPSAGQPE